MFILLQRDPAKYEIIDTQDEIKSPGEWYSTPLESITTKHWQICSVLVTYKVKCSFIRGVHRREPPIYFEGLASLGRRQTGGRRRSVLHLGRECMHACFRSVADGWPSWGWCHSRAFSLHDPAGSPEKKSGAGEDAPHSPSRRVYAYLLPPCLPVSRAAVCRRSTLLSSDRSWPHRVFVDSGGGFSSDLWVPLLSCSSPAGGKSWTGVAVDPGWTVDSGPSPQLGDSEVSWGSKIRSPLGHRLAPLDLR